MPVKLMKEIVLKCKENNFYIEYDYSREIISLMIKFSKRSI